MTAEVNRKSSEFLCLQFPYSRVTERNLTRPGRIERFRESTYRTVEVVAILAVPDGLLIYIKGDSSCEPVTGSRYAPALSHRRACNERRASKSTTRRPE